MRYLGERARYPGEKCPSCIDPGVGMTLEVAGNDPTKGRWVCSRCRAKGERSFSTICYHWEGGAYVNGHHHDLEHVLTSLVRQYGAPSRIAKSSLQQEGE